MNTILLTADFRDWLSNLRDSLAKAKIVGRLKRAEMGNFGDHNFFDGIGEMRIDTGPGYRIYFAKKGDVVYVVLGAGTKKTQQADIQKVTKIWGELKG